MLRKFSRIFSICCSCVRIRGGRSPLSLSLSRSFSVKAVPLLSTGSFSKRMPVGVRLFSVLLIVTLSHCMFYQGVVAFILLAQTVGLTVEQTGAEAAPTYRRCNSGMRSMLHPSQVCYHPGTQCRRRSVGAGDRRPAGRIIRIAASALQFWRSAHGSTLDVSSPRS